MTFFRKFRNFAVCLCLFVYSVQAEEVVTEKASKTTLHLVAVVDTIADNIKNSTKKDLINIVNEAKKISTYTGMKLKTSILQGKKVDYTTLSRRVKNLKVGSDDMVFFYYSGHGYRTDDKGNNPWPDLAFPESNEGIDFSLLVEQLVRKRPRFILAIADACNNVIDETFMISHRSLKKRLSSTDIKLLKKNYKHLFLYSHGLVMASAAVAGDYANALEEGGLYTLAFLEALHIEVTDSTANAAEWNILMQKSQDRSNHWYKAISFVSNGITYHTKSVLEQYPQWIHLETISDIPTTLNAIGR